MVSADMCKHDWPGTSCPECREEARLRRLACMSVGTKQCAAVCLSNLPSYDFGECPRQEEVWTWKAMKDEAARRPNGPLAKEWTK